MAYPRKTNRYARKRKAGTRKVVTTTVKRVMKKMRIPRDPSYQIFPKTKNVAFSYKHQSTTITSSGLSATNYISWRLNSLFDCDQTNVLGNKGPLFKDVLLGANGPYRDYKVNAWRVKFTLINLSDKALYVYYDPASYAIAEADIQSEMQNRRGVIQRLITGQNNAKPITMIKHYTTLKSIAPNSISSSENYSAPYSADPSKVLYANLLWNTVDASTAAYSVAVQVEYTAYATLYNADSTASA